MNLDPATADPRELAAALRRECNRAINCDAFMDPPGVVPRFAAFALAVLDECDRWRVGNKIDPRLSATGRTVVQVKNTMVDAIIRVAARAWVANGGTLPGKEGEGE